MAEKLETLVKDIREARKIAEPYEKEFVDRFKEFAKEVKTFVKENKWYSAYPKYRVVADLSYVGIHMFEFLWDSKVVYLNLHDGEDEIPFEFDEIENPLTYLKRDYAVWLAENNHMEETIKKAKIAELERELEKLRSN